MRRKQVMNRHRTRSTAADAVPVLAVAVFLLLQAPICSYLCLATPQPVAGLASNADPHAPVSASPCHESPGESSSSIPTDDCTSCQEALLSAAATSLAEPPASLSTFALAQDRFTLAYDARLQPTSVARAAPPPIEILLQKSTLLL